MKALTKIILSIAILCGGSMLVGAIRTASGGSTGGLSAFVIMPAIIAGIAAIWRYNSNNKTEDTNKTLKKD
ncbi:hypothetical protein [Arcticibacter sp. MXS-1]|uniref:hypothetical protein n=1 Tax=Arcticibacter sp. MXS-1 TaxID=3341726 RepID=UPI0035A838A4